MQESISGLPQHESDFSSSTQREQFLSILETLKQRGNEADRESTEAPAKTEHSYTEARERMHGATQALSAEFNEQVKLGMAEREIVDGDMKRDILENFVKRKKEFRTEQIKYGRAWLLENKELISRAFEDFDRFMTSHNTDLDGSTLRMVYEQMLLPQGENRLGFENVMRFILPTLSPHMIAEDIDQFPEIKALYTATVELAETAGGGTVWDHAKLIGKQKKELPKNLQIIESSAIDPDAPINYVSTPGFQPNHEFYGFLKYQLTEPAIVPQVGFDFNASSAALPA